MDPKALPEQLTIKLRSPVKFGDLTIAELDLKEPTAEQVEKASGEDGMTSNMLLIAEVSGQPIGLIRKIGIRDVQQATAYLKRFIDGDPPTGPK